VELVTAVSDAILAAIRPGVTLGEVQKVAYAAIPESQRRYMQTGSFFGHHIGLNVGDSADFDAVLAPGMVFTVEPWYYNHDTGIAAFIEDNVVVTESGVRVLSNALPREATELERMILP
jgi:Xaa-Pro aminopeptidase